MRKINTLLTSEGKSSKNKHSKRAKAFGYQMLGFGGGSGDAGLEFDYLIVMDSDGEDRPENKSSFRFNY